MGKIEVTQVKSTIDRPKNQKLNIEALGLGKLHKSKVHENTPVIMGMVRKVSHLVEVKEL